MQFQLLALSWSFTHPATSQGPHVAAFSVVVGVLRLVTSTQGLLAGRDVMMAASFSLQDLLGVFFMLVCKPSHFAASSLVWTRTISRFADVSCIWWKLVLCSVMHEKVVLSNSRSMFFNGKQWLVFCSYGVSSGKPVPHLLLSYSCTPHYILCHLLSRPLLPSHVCVFSTWHLLHWLYLLLHTTMTCQSCLWTGQLQWYHKR